MKETTESMEAESKGASRPGESKRAESKPSGRKGWVATLPMYDFPDVAWATDRLWQAIAARLREKGLEPVPEKLTRPEDPYELWNSADLLLGQTCGYPLMTKLGSKVQLVATPRYGAPGCRGAEHCSFIIVAKDSPLRSLAQLRNKVCAINGRDSNTGMNLLRATIAPLTGGGPFFATVIETGSHAGSLEAVAEGKAAVAAIDCVTHAHLSRCKPDEIAATRIFMETPATPCLPLITAAETNAPTRALLRAVLEEVAQDPDLAAVRETLFIKGFAALPRDGYQRVLDLERLAYAAHYPELV